MVALYFALYCSCVPASKIACTLLNFIPRPHLSPVQLPSACHRKLMCSVSRYFARQRCSAIIAQLPSAVAVGLPPFRC